MCLCNSAYKVLNTDLKIKIRALSRSLHFIYIIGDFFDKEIEMSFINLAIESRVCVSQMRIIISRGTRILNSNIV